MNAMDEMNYLVMECNFWQDKTSENREKKLYPTSRTPHGINETHTPGSNSWDKG